MNTDFIKNLNDKAKESMEPISKIGNLFSSSIQETLSFQMESAKKYSELVSEQMKSFATVRDSETMQEFTKGQMDALAKFNEQVISDFNTLSENGQKFSKELQEIIHAAQSDKSETDTKQQTATKPKTKA
mgnify:CR=1 FL=1